MKRLILYFIVLLFVVWVGVKIAVNPGYVLIAYQDWSLETTLWFSILSIIIFLLLVYIVARIFDWLLSLSGRLHNWASKRRIRRAQKFTNQGLCELAEGNWKQAEKSLLKGTITKQTTLINYLAAARAAQGQQAFERRDEYLRKAHHTNPHAEIAIGLTQAQLQYNAAQLEQALATLKHLQRLQPHHVYILKLLNNVYMQLNDWKELLNLLPELRKYNALKIDELKCLEQKIYTTLLIHATKKNDKAIEQIWNTLPKQLKRDKTILLNYTDYLITHHAQEKAERLLYETIKKSWDNQLVYQYGNTAGVKPAKQLSNAEAWLKTHSEDSLLLLTLGKLCAQHQLWGKARDYLEMSIKFGPSSEAYYKLGQVLQQLDDEKTAGICYKKGLELSSTASYRPQSHIAH